MVQRIILYFLSEKREVSVFNDFNLLRLNRTIRKIGYEEKRLETNHWTRTTQGTACSRADFLGSGRRFCFSEFN